MRFPYVLYSDFNCPFCYVLHERLYEMSLMDRCEWREVQHAPHLPRPMKCWQDSLGAELRREVAVVQRLAPGLPISVPPGKPNTMPAIHQAVLLAQNAPQGMAFVRQAYRAFWRTGLDLSDPIVLERLVKTAGGQSDPGTAAYRETADIAKEWEANWRATGQAGVPLIVSPESDLLVGCAPAEDVRRFFT